MDDHKAALVTSAASSIGAWLTLGVQVWTALAAFMGASLILSFLPLREGMWRMLLTVAMCTLLGIMVAPIIEKNVQWLDGFAPAVAFLSAAIAQVVIPLFIEYKNDIFLWALSFLPGRKEK